MTTTKTKLITLAEVRKELKRIAAENPTRVNPMDEATSGCLYHKGRGRNISRCLIGQMGYEMGLPTPAADDCGVDAITTDHDGIWRDRFTPAAVDYMANVQREADGGLSNPIPWGQVKL